MRKEEDLIEAIAECQGEKNPNANTCMKLAAYYTILNNIRGDILNVPSYSFSSEPTERVMYDSGTEFSEAVKGMNVNDFMEIMDDLMEALQVLMPKIYYSTLDKISEK